MVLLGQQEWKGQQEVLRLSLGEQPVEQALERTKVVVGPGLQLCREHGRQCGLRGPLELRLVPWMAHRV